MFLISYHKLHKHHGNMQRLEDKSNINNNCYYTELWFSILDFKKKNSHFLLLSLLVLTRLHILNHNFKNSEYFVSKYLIEMISENMFLFVCDTFRMFLSNFSGFLLFFLRRESQLIFSGHPLLYVSGSQNGLWNNRFSITEMVLNGTVWPHLQFPISETL